jgi:hypothetical protein
VAAGAGRRRAQEEMDGWVCTWFFAFLHVNEIPFNSTANPAVSCPAPRAARLTARATVKVISAVRLMVVAWGVCHGVSMGLVRRLQDARPVGGHP